MSNEYKPFEEDGTDVEVAEPKIAEPVKYAVLLHNDDYTSMEFVVEVLTRFFKRTEEEATQIMLKVHHEGRGLAGVYSREVAETKVEQVLSYAESNEFPLKCTCEPLQ